MPTVKTRGERPIDLYYERSGPEGVDPVLLVMGLGTTLDAWDLTAPVLAEKRDVIRFDNRGIGRTEKPRGRYRTAEMAEDALALLDHLGLGRVQSLLGLVDQRRLLYGFGRVLEAQVQKALGPALGSVIHVTPRSDRIHLFDATTGKRL